MVRRLRKDELQQYAHRSMFNLTDDEVNEYHVLTEAIFDLLEPLAVEVGSDARNVDAVRHGGDRPTPEEDPLNAVIRWCSVKSGSDGPLAGRRVGLKDNMAVAGVPMTYGSKVLQDYFPSEDSVIADRILRAGGQIVAKLNLDSFAWSGGGETSDFGAILNPYDLERTAGGSSGGSAASLFYDRVDITFGTDQAGSVRIPASWCGVLGLKPTHGLVPYTGIAAIDHTFDHVGPLARSVEDLAIALQVVAGWHESDPRQCRTAAVGEQQYASAVQEAPDDLRGIRVGILKEGFLQPVDDYEGMKETEIAARSVIEKFHELGADVREVSIPEHGTGAAMMFVTLAEGQTAITNSFGNGYHFRGRYAPDLAIALGEGLRSRGNYMPPTLKRLLLVGNYLRDQYFSSFYALAQNYIPRMRAPLDRALADVDVLLMPTCPYFAHKRKPQTSISDRVLRGTTNTMIANTATFDATGHPCLSIPAAEAKGLPIGIMLVGSMFTEAMLLKIARTYELNCGWFPQGPPAFGS